MFGRRHFGKERLMLAICRGLIVSGLLVVALALETAPPAAAASLIVIERATTDTVTRVGPKNDNVGDILTFANEIYDQDNKKLLGHDNGWCVRMVVGESWQCRWTLILDKGQITVTGPYYDNKQSVLSVTGGTGDYNSVQGQMKLRQRDQKGTEFEFIYSLIE
jgi:allene oxide cyclase